MNLCQRPSDDECFDYHRDYVAKVPDGDILQTLANQARSAKEFIASFPAESLSVIHAPYGWPIQTVVEHCCDAERVFGYRTLRFAAGDPTDLPGWDENHYAACGYGRHTDASGIANEFEHLRIGNLQLLQRLDAATWSNSGTADGRRVSVRTLAWLMAGHWLHHEAILRKRLQLPAKN